MGTRTATPKVSANVRTVKVEGLRILPSDNPNIAFVAKFVANGKPKSRAVTVAQKRAGATASIAAGTLTLPVAKRGRKAAEGMTQAQLDALLASLD
jgi:hypothetical protein